MVGVALLGNSGVGSGVFLSVVMLAHLKWSQCLSIDSRVQGMFVRLGGGDPQ